MIRRTAFAGCVLAAGFAACAAGAVAAGSDGVRLPPFERVTLANGTVLALMEKHDTPLVAMRAVIRGGALGDPAGKEGTAALYAELIQKGAGSRDAAAFAEAIEGAGGELSSTSDTEMIAVDAAFLARDAGLMIELVADALARPRLASEEFAKVRTLAVQSIAAAKDSDPSGLLDAYGYAWLFGAHPYGRPPGGDERSLATVTIDDVKAYNAAQTGGDRLIIAVVGDFRAADIRSRVERAFAGWRKATGAVPQVTAARREPGRRVLLVDKPGATQAYFWLGQVGASRADPTRTTQSLVNSVFGGQFTSMLNTELRVKSGLSYGAASGFDRFHEPGAFRITSYTQTARTVEALDRTLATLDRLHANGIDAQALEAARRYVLGQFPPTIETNGQLAVRLVDLVFYGLGPEDVDGFAARIGAVDVAAAKATIERDFPRSQDLAIVLIGDAAQIRDAARRYGGVTEMKITDPIFAPGAAR